MRLRRIEVWSFRGLDHYVLDDLAPDLNLVVGPNEAGKSRLFKALHCALFERYKGEGEDKRSLRTWGASDSPRVQVEFEAGGVVYTLTKQFLKSAFARLEGGGRTYEDDEAEAKLRELWGTRAAERKKEAADALGLWPLLWVPQGQAGAAPHEDMNEDTRARLRDALAVQVAEVAAGEVGQRLMRRIEAERAKHWTPSGKEGAELTRARARVASARAELDRARAQLEASRGLADKLSAARERLAELEPRLRAQRAAHAEAVKMLEAARARAHAIETARAHRDACREQKRAADGEVERRAALQRERDATAQAIEESAAALRALEGRKEAHRAREEAARTALAAAQEAEQAAEVLLVRARRQVDRASERERLARAREVLHRAREEKKLDEAVVRELAELRVGPAEIRALRAAGERDGKAQAALDAASAHLRMRALRDLVVDGKKVRAGEEIAWACDEETSIDVEGVLRFSVQPGGAELARLREEALAAKRAFGAMLAELGVGSIAQAEDAYELRAQLQAQHEARKAAAARLAPEGIDALEREVVAAEARLAALGEDDASAPAAAAAEDGVADAKDRVKSCLAKREVVSQEAQALAGEHARCAQRRALGEERLAALDDKLRRAPSPEALEKARDAAEKAWAAAEDRLVALEMEHGRLGGLGAAQDVEREHKALERMTSERQAQHDIAVAAEAQLSRDDANGLLEAVQSAEEEAERAERDLARLERAANAVRALAEAVRAARREAEERLVAPVLERVRPWVQGLFSRSSLRIDEHWNVLGLQTGDVEEPLEALSGGAREQLGILVRLGLAEVLAKDEGLPIVLDDSLAYTDEARHREMLRILYRASKKQQIIVFSCHAVAFERLGETKRYELPARRAL